MTASKHDFDKEQGLKGDELVEPKVDVQKKGSILVFIIAGILILGGTILGGFFILNHDKPKAPKAGVPLSATQKLCQVITKGDFKEALELIKKIPTEELNTVGDNSHQTALNAVYYGYEESKETEKKAAYLEILRVLLEKKADPTVRSLYGESTLRLAAMLETDTKPLEMMIASPAFSEKSLRDRGKALLIAASTSSGRALSVLAKQPEFNCNGFIHYNESMSEPLLAAVYYEQGRTSRDLFPTFLKLVAMCKANPNVKTVDGTMLLLKTLMDYRTKEEDPERKFLRFPRTLLKYGATVDQKVIDHLAKNYSKEYFELVLPYVDSASLLNTDPLTRLLSKRSTNEDIEIIARMVDARLAELDSSFNVAPCSSSS